ncbi:MAG: energy-coupling factor transporter ATPase [Lachnospiraceae bacterium]|nr:energy-coupling factor transporter ATPase [Lachnospiraceae bacterium]
MELKTENLTYEYESNSATPTRAVDGVSFVIPGGEFLGIVGHTGSGKTTLVQLLDGLLKPSAGTVYLDGEDINAKNYSRKKMRAGIGIVFQYPEYQLFESTILKDVCFGPKNQGLKDEEAEKVAVEALKRVGIKEEQFELSPFELSGGQRRRVAIAGVLAMQPKILILDEPTAGLDPAGREEMLSLMDELNRDGMTIILISHSMEDVAAHASRIMVLDKGKVFLDGAPAEVFAHVEELENIGLAAPEAYYILEEIRKAGLEIETENTVTVEDAVSKIKKSLC